MAGRCVTQIHICGVRGIKPLAPGRQPARRCCMHPGSQLGQRRHGPRDPPGGWYRARQGVVLQCQRLQAREGAGRAPAGGQRPAQAVAKQAPGPGEKREEGGEVVRRMGLKGRRADEPGWRGAARQRWQEVGFQMCASQPRNPRLAQMPAACGPTLTARAGWAG